MKKVLMVFMAFTVFFASLGAFASDADARRGGGGFKSTPKSYTTTPKRSDNTSGSVNSTNRSNTGTGANATTGKRGFFSGGSLFTGLMIGGLAGMLFGGMFANMGGFGDFLGLIVNLLAIYVLFIAARGIYRMIRQRKKPADPYDRR
ncbi:hypothetical protein SK066_10350 [Paenibacillus hunanensis]|uniref:hypothetical protein n=1 Tax=Paenibacillus hunanensis TaxID=539262 RepID=UPI00202729C0|nr:hypothetical protein [Paenibacillus hunanensis]MCL9662938.1 hypothetical protein [Paenibacillus hunanensis]WPP43300.1 hypothetical protein SK066_10350 [Paenibacillus hunanensis]